MVLLGTGRSNRHNWHRAGGMVLHEERVKDQTIFFLSFLKLQTNTLFLFISRQKPVPFSKQIPTDSTAPQKRLSV
jgi:hypothetical protein